MIPPQLAGLRVGAVSYLNTKPLIWGIDPSVLHLAVPAQLAADFYAGRYDVALLPIFAVLKAGGGLVADDIAIACRGPVYSVFVASQGAFEDCTEIYLDPSSRSSAALLRVLIAEFYGNRIRLVESPEIPAQAARLLIGDPAIQFRQRHAAPWQIHDLGALWQKHTGLPFVFAAWTIAPAVANPHVVAEYLRSVKAAGQVAREHIATGEPAPAFALHYLTESIRFNLREDEKEAVALFARFGARHGLIEPDAALSYC